MRSILAVAAAIVALSPAALPAKQPVKPAVRGGVRAPAPPWPPRVRIRIRGMRRGHGLVNPRSAPREPASPPSPALAKLGAALQQLCGAKLPRAEARRLAGWITKYAKTFDVDPFVLGALIHRQSRCVAGRARRGVGIAGIRPAIHRRFISGGAYRFWIKRGRRWIARELRMGRFALTRRALRSSEASVYFAAGLLAVYGQQCRDLDAAFPGMPHRHPVAHMIWGDRVRSTEEEELILRDRRRLLQYYAPTQRVATRRFKGVQLFSPLDGAPRKITSGYYARRGRRRHRALDYLSDRGEPVRAVADGKIVFAGVSRRRGRSRRVAPRYSARYPRRLMGIGGLFVLIAHRRGLTSGYFHLDSFTVKTGQRVKAGQLIGTVGRTGIKRSPAHLHFELRYRGGYLDPQRVLGRAVVPLRKTWFGRHVALRRRRRRVRRRRRRRRSRRRSAHKRRRKKAHVKR